MTVGWALAQFGIPPQVENVWRLLVQQPTATTEDLLATGVNETELAAALTTLVAARLIHDAPSPSRYRAFDPRLAVQALVADAQRELAERTQELANVQTALGPISDAYVTGRIATGIDRGIETLASLDEVRDQIVLAGRRCREQVRSIIKNGTAESVAASHSRDPEQFSRGQTQRSIVDVDTLANREFYEAFAENSRQGDLVRSMVDAPTQLLIYDDALAIVPLDITQPRHGAMLIRERPLIAILIHMFEHYWREATPIYVEGTGTHLATKRQIQVLEFMASGRTDEAIARTLDVGVRTLRREVAALREALGVNSRTEIIAAAIRRGWL